MKKIERDNFRANMYGFRTLHGMLAAHEAAVQYMLENSAKKGRTRLENALAAAFYGWSQCPSAISDVLHAKALKELQRAGYKKPKRITIHQFEPK